MHNIILNTIHIIILNTIHNIILNTIHNIRPRICSIGRNQNSALSLFMIYQGICSKSYTAGTNSGSAGTAYPSESPRLPPGYYSGVNFVKSLVFYAMLCRSLFVFFPFGRCFVCPSTQDYPFDIFKLFFALIEKKLKTSTTNMAIFPLTKMISCTKVPTYVKHFTKLFQQSDLCRNKGTKILQWFIRVLEISELLIAYYIYKETVNSVRLIYEIELTERNIFDYMCILNISKLWYRKNEKKPKYHTVNTVTNLQKIIETQTKQIPIAHMHGLVCGGDAT